MTGEQLHFMVGGEKYPHLSTVSCPDSAFLPERVSEFFCNIVELIPRGKKKVM